MSRPLKVFLCHAHADTLRGTGRDAVPLRAYMRALYSRLKKDGVDAWLDKESLLPSADWAYEIRKAARAGV
ncbi:MAG: toll/interleukin-1 receptor domain-containing protein [Chloroflexi bacterium]|nr:toll/interleukin-1 receptor domain-containing protein [Chloroflexota bacterium]